MGGRQVGSPSGEPSSFALLREPATWVVAALAVIGACAPALGDYLDGGEGDLTLVDATNAISVKVEEDECSSGSDGVDCDYDAVVVGGRWAGSYSLTVRYPPDGSVVVVEAVNEGRGTSFAGEMEILPAGLAEGDDEIESEEGNVLSVKLDRTGVSATDLDGGTWEGCKEYVYELGFSSKPLNATVCPTIGVVRIESPVDNVTLVRDP